ncbi:MAG TPA: sugar ABC transporter permease [Roseiflexaceae bacterium]|nr:sugar ABC transporter permease [Roseiflexaceae bacterium]
MAAFPTSGAPRASQRPQGRMAREEERAAYLFLLPWLIGIVLFLIGPIIASIVLSLTNWNIITEPSWVGIANYREMLFEDRKFWQSLRVTLYYTILSVPLYLTAGLAISLLLNLRLRGMYAFRTILYMPAVISGVAVAVLWLTLLNPDLGAINQFLRGIGIANPPRWLNSQTWAVPALVLVGLWGVGSGAIIYLAGLQNIPPQLYEAAEIDGASPWQRFVNVTLPMLTPTLFFSLITGLVGAFQVFDTAFIMGGSRGGTSGALNFYLLNLWNEGFRSGRLGYASALAWVLVILAAVVIMITFRTSDRWVYYETEPEKR